MLPYISYLLKSYSELRCRKKVLKRLKAHQNRVNYFSVYQWLNALIRE